MNIITVLQTLMRETIVPEQYVEWSSMSLIAGLLQRRVFIMYQGRPLYPNTYTMLVGPAGIGKSWAISEICAGISRQIETMFVAADSVTKEEIYENMEQAQSPYEDHKGQVKMQSALCVYSDEFQLFLDGTDTKFVQALCKLYDCGESFTHQIKTGKSSHAIGPCLTICGGATFDGLTTIFTTNSTERGILRRFFFISSESKKELELPPRVGTFGHVTDLDAGLRNCAVGLAKEIHAMRGEFMIEPDAYDIFVKQEVIYRKKIASKVTAWFNARDALLLKLCMLRAVANNMELVIKKNDIEEAIYLLDIAAEHIETSMRCVISTPQTISTMQFVDHIKNLVRQSGKKSVPIQLVNRMLMQYVRPNEVRATLDQLVNAGICTIESIGSFATVRFEDD